MMISRRKKVLALPLFWFGGDVPQMAAAAAAGNLDELLEQTRSARQREAQANEERERSSPASAPNSLRSSPRRVRRSRGALTRASLAAAFDSNEKRLTELQTQLDAKAGNLGEMFERGAPGGERFFLGRAQLHHQCAVSGSRRLRRKARAGKGAAVDDGSGALLVRAAA
jgi:hypothetical protein